LKCFRNSVSPPWSTSFFFLIHSAEFSAAIIGMDLPQAQAFTVVDSFDFGVELDRDLFSFLKIVCVYFRFSIATRFT